MLSRTRIAGFDGRYRIILAARVVGGLALLGVYLADARYDPAIRTPVAWAVGLWLVWTTTMHFLALRQNPCPFSRLMTASVLSDSATYALLTVAYGTVQNDPFYVWYLTEVVLVVLLVRTRWAWMLGWVLGASYTISRLAIVGYAELLSNVILISNVVVFVLIAFVVESALRAEDDHAHAVEQQRIEALELNERLERSVDELRAVTRITDLIHSTLDIDAVGPSLLEILERVVHIPVASLYVLDTDKRETVFSTSRGLPVGRTDYSGLELAGAKRVDREDGALSCLELLEGKGHVVVMCADPVSLDGLTADDRIVLQAVAGELIVAVENSRLYRLTTRLAITDELTDLFNYRFFQQRLDDEMARADRYGKRLSLLMLDLDDFKRLNDTHGHLVGDRVLAEFGQLMRSVVREVDVVARYGGEEFSVILPETDASGAFIAAEKIREAVALHRFADASGEPRIHLSCSIGLASYPIHVRDKEALLRAADDALYLAKTTGRNRVRAPRLRLERLPADETTIEEVAE